jgi:hypothetical protein
MHLRREPMWTCAIAACGMSLSGCGASEPSAAGHRVEPTHAAEPSDEAEGHASANPPGSSEVTFEDGTNAACALRARAGVVSAQCDGASLRCAEVARADLADAPGDEVLARCDGPEGGTPGEGGRALSLSNGDTVLWMVRLDEIRGSRQWSCSFPTTSRITLVSALPGARRQVFLQIRGCTDGAADHGHSGELFAWSAGEMATVADAGVHCTYTGNTGDPDAPPPPAGRAFECDGSFLEVGDQGIARVSVPAPVLIDSPARSGENVQLQLGPRATREPLSWNAESSRFAPVPR